MAGFKPKAMLIGLDGVSFELLKDLTERNIMPNLKKLMNNGVFKKTHSSLPEVSSVAWASIITGKNPAEHGIFGFTDLDRDSYKLVFKDSRDLKIDSFWGRNKKLRYLIVNIPGTYPVSAINGAIISGFVSLDIKKSCYPSSLVELLEKYNYQIEPDIEIAHQDLNKFVASLFSNLESHHQLLNYLLTRKHWDVFMYVFTGTDRLMHFLWSAYEDKRSPYHCIFIDYFHKIDSMIGNFIDYTCGVKNLFLFSDHGFEKLKQEVYINNVLKNAGFLFVDDNNISSLNSRTKAFSLDPARVYIHWQGIFKNGKIKLNQKKDLINDLKKLFTDLKFDGKRIIKKVYRKEDIYHGPYLDSAPDLVLLANKGFNLRSSLSQKSVIASPSIFSGKHSFDNAFFLANTAFRGSSRISSIFDVGRTIQEMLV